MGWWQGGRRTDGGIFGDRWRSTAALRQSYGGAPAAFWAELRPE
ncbi:hypothetical protein A2U01_0094176, partial [Trifolium medium]|nr:hypothetical protein [Trifolium medium]